ncbi:sulfatase [Parapedobacter tibetensis]|uniref:sulfatase n=1 Tax=Parapedobacter tibetensis TaxID=2972951 RepID=UPI00214D35FF|nr:sulfatase [Parapedobacter tibetensis]
MKPTYLLVLYLLMIAGRHDASAQQPAARRPNVLLILVDDLKPATGSYGDPVAITPNIDRLASKGMQFNHAYANQAVCGPSRYNLMLGSRSSSTGIYTFGRDFRKLYPEAVTLPQYFKQNGYHCESMGKVYHIGHGSYNDTASWSVPHHKDLVVEYVDPASTGGKLTREEALFGNRDKDLAKTLIRGPAWESPEVEDDAYADGRTANRAIQRLRALKKNPEQPFFLAIGFARPHLPFSVPQKYWDRYDPEKLPMPFYEKAPKGAPDYAGKRDVEISQYSPIPLSSEQDPFPAHLTRKLIHGYYAGVSYVDTQIGKVLQELEALDLDENTIVVFWGDHGFHLGELGIWTKHVNYELACRIPLIVCAPGITRPGTHTDQPAETVDIYPTLAALAGLDKPGVLQPFDGLSMVSVLQHPEVHIRDHVYHCFPRGGRLGRAIRTDRYRLVEWKKIGADPQSAELELYDYQDGPVEHENIADQRPEVVAALRKLLNTHPEAKQ